MLDPGAGKITSEFQLPPLAEMKAPPRWGYINVVDEYLIGGADPLYDPKLLPKPPRDPREGDDKDPPTTSSSLTRVLALLKNFSDNMSASRHLVVMNRHTGQVLWKVSARHAFRHNAICVGGGRLYAIDRPSRDDLARAAQLRATEDDVRRLRKSIATRLNLETSLDPEILAFARRVRPHAVCIVPEDRDELTAWALASVRVAAQSRR